MSPVNIVKYDAACQAIAAACAIDEVKDIRDKAEAMQVYARQAKNFEMENQATRIRLRAERRAGELLAAAKADGKRHNGRGNNPKKKLESEPRTPTPPTLSELNISKRQSSEWQQIAAIPLQEFEAKLTAVETRREKTTTAAILKPISEAKKYAGHILRRPTPNGHRVEEVASGLQWFIRQGDFGNAMYCATEILYHIGGEDGSAYTFLWNRLLTIASEDIGLADPMAAPLVLSLYGYYLAMKDQGKRADSLLQLTQAVATLAYTQKSRLMDTATISFFSALRMSMTKPRSLPQESQIFRDQIARELPDVVYDKHTEVGRVQLKRGFDHFWEEKTHLVDEVFFNPDGTPTDPYLAQAKAVTRMEEILGKREATQEEIAAVEMETANA